MKDAGSGEGHRQRREKQGARVEAAKKAAGTDAVAKKILSDEAIMKAL